MTIRLMRRSRRCVSPVRISICCWWRASEIKQPALLPAAVTTTRATRGLKRFPLRGVVGQLARGRLTLDGSAAYRRDVGADLGRARRRCLLRLAQLEDAHHVDQRSVLLRHLVHLGDGVVDLLDAVALLGAGAADVAHDVGHALYAGDHL